MTPTFRIVPAIALAIAFLGGAAEAQTIKIGVNEPLTGAFAASGTYVVNGPRSLLMRSMPRAGSSARRSS